MNTKKGKSEALIEDIQKLEEMFPLDYFKALNDETKDALIGLCFNRNLLDEETNGETEEGDYENEED